jgi:hypothetical protein
MTHADWVAAGWSVLGAVIGCALGLLLIWLLNRPRRGNDW